MTSNAAWHWRFRDQQREKPNTLPIRAIFLDKDVLILKTTQELQDSLLATLHEEQMRRESYRIAFTDQEFLSRRETRSVRMQLEMLKPDVVLQEHGIDNTIVVFGSARFKSQAEANALLLDAEKNGDAIALAAAKRIVKNAEYYEAARTFGKIVAAHNAQKTNGERFYICTGGGPGVMEAANRGAHEAGCKSVGLAIALPHEEKPNAYITPELCFRFHYFAARKMHFVMRARALVVFAGGFGTLDELFEILTLVQTRKSHAVPILLYGSAYWKKVINFEALVEEGAISPEDLKLFHYVDDPHECWNLMRSMMAEYV